MLFTKSWFTCAKSFFFFLTQCCKTGQGTYPFNFIFRNAGYYYKKLIKNTTCDAFQVLKPCDIFI